jgi:hypothetical protein
VELAVLAKELAAERATLPDYVADLIDGYTLPCYQFECVECLQKLTLVGLPVFFDAGSVGQTTYGLLICFLTLAIYSTYVPFANDRDNKLFQLCQTQTFFTLLASLVVRSFDQDDVASYAFDVMLSVMTYIPIAIGIRPSPI